MIEPDKLVGYLRGACADILARGTIDSTLKYPLRPGQREGLEAFAVFLDRTDLTDAQKLEGFFEMPTGVGKTAFFGALIDRVYQRAFADGHKLRIGIVAPRIKLLTQTKKGMQKLFPRLNRQIGLYGGKDRDKSKPITIITYDSWATLTDQGELNKDSFDLLISDEAHRGTSEAREKHIDAYTGIGRYALTATAHYDLEQTVFNTHKNKIFEKHIAASVQDGELASYVQVQLHVIRVVPDGDDSDDLKRVKQLGFNRFVENKLVTGKDERTGDPLTDNQIGVYVQDTTQADHLEELLNNNPILQEIARKRGCKAFAVSIHTNGMSPGERDNRDNDYIKGRYLCRIGDELFKEGDDHPPMKVVIDMRHESVVDKAQILGRGARYWYNAAKNRSEGLTVVDTITYVGCEPDDDKGIDAQRAREIEERNRSRAIAYSVTAIDILDGNIAIASPTAPPLITSPSNPPVEGTRTGLSSALENKQPIDTAPTAVTPNQGLPLASNESTPPWGIATVPSGIAVPVYPTLSEGVVAGENKLGGQDTEIIRPPMPQPISSNPFERLKVASYTTMEDLKTYLAERDHLRSLETTTLNPLRRVEPLVYLAPGTPDRKFLDELWTQKGKPSGNDIFNALPAEAKESQESGSTILFQTSHNIDGVIYGRQKSLAQSQYEILISTLQERPDVIVDRSVVDLTAGSPDRKLLDELYNKKGRPNSTVLFDALPVEVKQPDAWGKPLFRSAHPIKNVTKGKNQKTMPRKQFDALIAVLEKRPDTAPREAVVELREGTPSRKILDQLLAEKGDPKSVTIFKALPQKAKRSDGKKEPLFKSHANIKAVLSGGQKTLRQSQFDTLISTLKVIDMLIPALKKRSDAGAPYARIDLSPGSPNRQHLHTLLAQKNQPGYQRIFTALPKTARKKNADGVTLYKSSSSLQNIINGNNDSILQAQFTVLISTIESLDPRVDLSSGSPERKHLDALRAQNGNLGGRRIFHLLPDSAKRKDANGKVLFKSISLVQAVFSGRQTSLPRSQFDVLISTIENAPSLAGTVESAVKAGAKEILGPSDDRAKKHKLLESSKKKAKVRANLKASAKEILVPSAASTEKPKIHVASQNPTRKNAKTRTRPKDRHFG